MARASVRVRNMSGEEHQIPVELNWTLLEVKQAMADQFELEADLQRVVYKGVLLDINRETLSRYGVSEGDLLHLCKDEDFARVTFRGLNDTFHERINFSFTTVEQLKISIAPSCGIRPADQGLKFGDVRLSGNHLLNHYRLPKNGCAIDVFYDDDAFGEVRIRGGKAIIGVNLLGDLGSDSGGSGTDSE